jgi:hypothetical protein
MATTTNYSWTTPDDTALVKDGASAIRTLGSSIDTTTKNLNPSTTLGDIEYRSSTANTNTRLGIGTTGQILTVAGGVPSWATPVTPASGLTLLNKTTLSSTTNVSLNNVFSATYDNYRIILEGSFSTDTEARLRLRVSGSDNSNSTYYFAMSRANISGTASTNAGNGVTSFLLFRGNTSSSSTSLDIYRPFATVKTTIGGTFFDRNGDVGGSNAGFFDATTSFDGLSVFFTNGCTGTLSVYGYGI